MIALPTQLMGRVDVKTAAAAAFALFSEASVVAHEAPQSTAQGADVRGWLDSGDHCGFSDTKGALKSALSLS